MVINGIALMTARPIKAMVNRKEVGPGGTSYGLGEAGYDIRIKQEIEFRSSGSMRVVFSTTPPFEISERKEGRFALASAIEEFEMPPDLVGIVHDKSTWARRGLSVFNTVIEPGWRGFLTLELVYHGEGDLVIPAGAGIAQVVFTQTVEARRYKGKYQNQEDVPVSARNSV